MAVCRLEAVLIAHRIFGNWAPARVMGDARIGGLPNGKRGRWLLLRNRNILSDEHGAAL